MNQNLMIGLQIVIALGLLNVWVVRLKKSTAFRGGEASNLREEFQVYGLPVWFFYLIGGLKVGSAFCLLAGLFVPGVVQPAAAMVVALMLGALIMHAKVKDPFIKFVPAALMLVMSASLLALSFSQVVLIEAVPL